MVNLEDLDNDVMLIVFSSQNSFDTEVMTKGDFLVSDYYLRDKTPHLTDVHLAIKSPISFNLEDIIRSISEENDCYSEWVNDVYYDICKSGLDVDDISKKINSAFENNPTYYIGDIVKVL